MLLKIFKNKLPVVHHSNGIENHSLDVLKDNWDKKTKKWYHFNLESSYRMSFSKANLVVTNGSYDADYLIKEKLASLPKVVAIEYGLDKFYLGQEINLIRPKVIGFVGSWISRKGSEIIKAAIPSILRKYRDYKFCIVGCGHEFNLKEHFPSDIHSQIEIIPFVKDKNKLKTIYQQFSIFIFPSIYDSFGLVLSEAMSCGVATIANKTGFAYNLRHAEEAYILEKNDETHLQCALNHLITHDSLRMKIARGGYKLVQTLTWERAVSRLDNEIRVKLL